MSSGCILIANCPYPDMLSRVSPHCFPCRGLQDLSAQLCKQLDTTREPAGWRTAWVIPTKSRSKKPIAAKPMSARMASPGAGVIIHLAVDPPLALIAHLRTLAWCVRREHLLRRHSPIVSWDLPSCGCGPYQYITGMRVCSRSVFVFDFVSTSDRPYLFFMYLYDTAVQLHDP